MPSDEDSSWKNEPYRVWYLEDGESQDELETEDGRTLDLTSKNPIGTLKEAADDGLPEEYVAEGHLRLNGHTLPGSLERWYGINADEAVDYLEQLEDQGICYTREFPGSYSYSAGW